MPRLTKSDAVEDDVQIIPAANTLFTSILGWHPVPPLVWRENLFRAFKIRPSHKFLASNEEWQPMAVCVPHLIKGHHLNIILAG